MTHGTEILRLSAQIDAGVVELSNAAQELAHAEHALRRARAEAWVRAPDGISPARQAWVESSTSDEHLRVDIAEARRTTAIEALRSRRQQMSAFQSLLKADATEYEEARYGAL